MSPEKYKKLIRGVGILALILVVFVVGAYAGTKPSIAHLLAPIKNDPSISSTAPEGEDLSQFWYVWNLMQKKYPFTAQAPDDQNKIYGAIKGLVSSYKDPYTVFFPPQESKLFKDQVAGSFGGVGMEVGIKNGAITVIAPLKGSPAEKAGIKSGDYIMQIGAKKTDDLSIDTAISLIRGTPGTEVTLTVLRVGSSDPLHFTIVREVVSLPTVDTEIKGDVFVISLYSFSENSAHLFTDALDAFIASGKKKMIIDLRDNPGGYLEAAVNIASYFLPAGKPVVRENAGPETEESVDVSKGFTLLGQNPEMIILVNGGSASASEILAGALSDHKVAKLLGTQTYGKGSVQQVVDLEGGASVKITIAKWFTPNGVSISEKGIKPDVVVNKVPVKDEKTGKYSDPQMEEALKLLNK